MGWGEEKPPGIVTVTDVRSAVGFPSTSGAYGARSFSLGPGCYGRISQGNLLALLFAAGASERTSSAWLNRWAR
eukprot:2308980-Rhodomonas_salina.1